MYVNTHIYIYIHKHILVNLNMYAKDMCMDAQNRRKSPAPFGPGTSRYRSSQ